MIIRKLRLDRGLSQEQLAEMAGISTRTLQRLERGAKVSPETLKCLAAVLEVDFKMLRENQMIQTNETPKTDDQEAHVRGTRHQNEPANAPVPPLSKEEQKAMEYVRDIKAFYSHALAYGCVMAFLLVVNLMLYPGHINVVWPALGWGIGLTIHGLSAYEVFRFLGDDWEKKQIKKRLDRM